MGKDVKNKNAFGHVVDPCNQPVMVAVDIEHCPSTNDVSVREISPRLGQRAPVGPLSYPIPVHERHKCVRMPFSKLENRWFADDPHTLVYKTKTFLSRLTLDALNATRCPSKSC
jgi:hypothetical protein